MQTMLQTIRRDLHQIPELDHNLPKTLAYITTILKDLNCTILSPSNASIVAYFDFNQTSALAYRSDMDALPMQEVNALPYASKHTGQMHACGHDAHMAMLLGFAQYVNTLKTAKYNIILLFQPAEETTGGAQEIVASKLFDTYHVQAIFGIHVWPTLAKGVIASKSGSMMARSSEVNIEVYGASAHAAKFQEGKDALHAATLFLYEAYAMEACIQKNILRLLKFGKMESGTVRNVISNLTTIQGTLRTYDDDVFQTICTNLQTIASKIEELTGCTITLHFSQGYPPLINDEKLFTACTNLLPQLQILKEPNLLAEDFSFYQQAIPGVFFYLGTGEDIPLHSSNFDFDEAILQQGLQLYKTLLEIEFA